MGHFEKGRWIESTIYFGGYLPIGDIMYGIQKHIESSYTFDTSFIELQHINRLTCYSTDEQFIEYIVQLKLYKGVNNEC